MIKSNIEAGEGFADIVAEKGFFYPPDPGEKSATIGGNISTNAGGNVSEFAASDSR